tara:strand:+ start:3869 stop:4762 length:894 start_codon:yes stop_codon:yes gene_type:complete
MLPDNFDFAMLPDLPRTGSVGLKEIGLMRSSIESIDYAITSWLKEDLKLHAITNEGRTRVPVLWQTPERAYQLKNEKDLRDDVGALKLPLISIERTGITKDPARKGAYQAHIYSGDGDGRTGRMTIAKRIVEDKTRNFAAAAGLRKLPVEGKPSGHQQWYPRINKKVVIQTLSIPIPVYVDVDYKITIKTEYQQQMNDLVEPFIGRTGQINSFVLRRQGHLYEAFIQQDFSHNNNVASLNEDSRMFSTDITIKVLGYLIGEGENDDRQLVKIEENVVEITFPRERVALPGDSELLPD